jgi:benzodiazapine receptor
MTDQSLPNHATQPCEERSPFLSAYLMTRHNVVGIIGTAIIAFYIIVSGFLVSTRSDWYRSLSRPAWQPPGAMVGLIWLYNYTMLFVATWVVARRLSRTHHLVWLLCLALSVVSALLWAWLFFKPPHSIVASAVALVFATLFTIPLLLISFRVSLPLGVAFVPYQLWLALATSVAFGYAAQ